MRSCHLFPLALVLCGSFLVARDASATPTVVRTFSFETATTGVVRDIAGVGSTVYLAVSTSVSGNNLWSSDSTPGGTSLYSSFGTTMKLVPSGTKMFVRAGITLLVANGPGGVASLGSTQTDPFPFAGGVLFESSGQLWRSDGTPGGTTMLAPLNAAGTSTATEWTAFGGKVYFSADDGVYGREPYVTDGTAAGTRRLKDINGGAGPSNPTFLPGRATLFLSAKDIAHGRELWTTDGTEAGTVLVKDIAPGATDGLADPNVNFNLATAFVAGWDGALYFVTTGGSLIRSDGTAAGTTELKANVLSSGIFGGMVALYDRVLFLVASSAGTDLWQTTTTGATIVKNYNGAGGLFAYHNRAYFIANDLVSFGLFQSDGTSAGTGLLSTPPTNLLQPRVVNEQLVFEGYDQTGNGYEFWLSDGTTATFAGQTGGDSNPDHAAVVGSRVYYMAKQSAGAGYVRDFSYIDVPAGPPAPIPPPLPSADAGADGGASANDAGSGSDGGVGVDPTNNPPATPDGGANGDGATAPGSSSGCGCLAAGTSPPGAAALASLGLGVLVALRLRRRRRT